MKKLILLAVLSASLFCATPTAKAQNPPVAQVTPTVGTAQLIHDPQLRQLDQWNTAPRQLVGVVQMKIAYAVSSLTSSMANGWYGLDSFWYTYKITTNYVNTPAVTHNYGPMTVTPQMFSYAKGAVTNQTQTWDVDGIYNAVIKPYFGAGITPPEYSYSETVVVSPSYRYWRQYWTSTAHTAQKRDYYRKDITPVTFTFPPYLIWVIGKRDAAPVRGGWQLAMRGKPLIPMTERRRKEMRRTPIQMYNGYEITSPSAAETDPIPGTDNTDRFLYADQASSATLAAACADTSWWPTFTNGVVATDVLESSTTVPQSQWLALP